MAQVGLHFFVGDFAGRYDYSVTLIGAMSETQLPKRIIIFSLTYFPFVGGAEVAVKEIIERLPKEEYQFDLVTLRFDSKLPEIETAGNLTIHRIGYTKLSPSMTELRQFPLHFNKYLYPFFAAWYARTLHKKTPYDTIWSIMANYAGFAALFFKWTHPRVPFLLTLQEGDPEEHIFRRVGILKFLYNKIFRAADRIQTISHYLADFAKRRGARCEIVVVPNGVDVARFALVNESARDAIRKQFAISDNDILLITAGRLVVKNGVDDIIRALVLLPENIKLLAPGAGPQEVYLRSLIRELKLTDRVFIPGEVAHEKLPPYLHAADIFIRPSLSEGMGNSFIEAMAAGLPVIATPVGGIVDFLFDPNTSPDKKPTGIFCEVKKSETIVKAVLRITSDDALRAAIVKNAAALVRERYDWQIVAQSMHREAFGGLLAAPYNKK